MAFASLLGDGETAVDVGAHYGDYTMLAAARVGPHGLVHAFEPQAAVRAVLDTNVRTNGLTHVHVHAHAVADYEGEADLDFLEQVETGQASLVFAGARPQGQSCRVPVRRMDDVISGKDATLVTAVKVDVEGAEAAVLRGAMELLQEARPGVLFEVNGLTLGAEGYRCEAEDLLRSLGYDIYGMVRDRTRGFRLETLSRGHDPSGHREPWLALNLLAIAPGSRCEHRLRAAGHMG
jgi:FkbM family methyltransferase